MELLDLFTSGWTRCSLAAVLLQCCCSAAAAKPPMFVDYELYSANTIVRSGFSYHMLNIPCQAFCNIEKLT